MKPTASRVVRIAFTGLIVVMLVLFARTVDWRHTWDEIRNASWQVLGLAAIVNLLSLVLKGVRWWVFLRPVGADSIALAVRATFAGAGLNNILVANGGEAARVIFVSRAAHVPSARVLATFALERLFELIGYIVMLALAVVFLPLPHEIERVRPVALLALLAVVALMVYLVRHPERADVVTEIELGHWMGRLRAYGRRFLSTLTGISTAPRFTAALVLSVIVWALQVATYHLTAMAAHFPITLAGTVATLIAVNLGFGLRATPGNVGVFQVLYALAAVGFHLDKDQAIAVAFLIQTQQILPVTAIGVGLAPEFIFRRRRTPRPDNILPGEPLPAKGEGSGS